MENMESILYLVRASLGESAGIHVSVRQSTVSITSDGPPIAGLFCHAILSPSMRDSMAWKALCNCAVT